MGGQTNWKQVWNGGKHLGSETDNQSVTREGAGVFVHQDDDVFTLMRPGTGCNNGKSVAGSLCPSPEHQGLLRPSLQQWRHLPTSSSGFDIAWYGVFSNVINTK